MAKNGPTVIFYGSIFLYLIKLITLVFSAGMMGVAVFVTGLFWVRIISEVVRDPSVVTADLIGLFAIVSSLAPIGIWLFLLLTHQYPDIGISSDRIWYRPLFWWQSIPWEQVSSIEEAKTGGFFVFGLLAYSEELPFFYGAYGGMYGKYKGKAIVIPNRLRHFKRLEEEIFRHKHIWRY